MRWFLKKTIDLLIDMGPKIANLPQNERENYRDKVNETYRLFDTSISLVMNRLGDILSIPPDQQRKFFSENS